jgi:threonine/homoserine/homoserine lactone efflux protein
MINALIKGVTLGLLLAISVGPIVFTVIKQSISKGYKGGLTFIAGISCSDILLVIFSNLFTNLFTILNAHKKGLSIVASIFLIIVGVYYLFFKKPTIKESNVALKFNTKGYLKLFVTGFVMNIFNPGIIVFWLTTATTFIDHTLKERIIIFSIALFLALAADVAKVLLANRIRQKMTPRNIHLINRINGIILMGFGVVIILMQR